MRVIAMSTEGNDTPPAARAVSSELEDLLVDCIERIDADDADGVESLLRANPEHAAQLRTILTSLRGLSMVGEQAETEPDLPFQRLGQYRILRRLGQGGMGIVFLARQESVGRLVALKVVHAALAAHPAMLARFRREAQAIARLRHPNIVTVYDSGEDQGTVYMVMEFVPGTGLDVLIGEGGDRPLRSILTWTRDVARALSCAHDAGVIHRDVKPGNILITSDSRAMLLDFGLARDAEDGSLTVSGSFQGSPHYASPEQIVGARADIGPKSDIYSLGITLYEAATGTMPFAGATTEQVFQKILAGVLVPPRKLNAQIVGDLETVIQKATDRDPQHRYDSAAEFAGDLDALLSFRPIRARPPGPIRRILLWARRNRVAALSVAAVAVLAAVLAATLVFQRAAEQERRRDEARDALEKAERRLAELIEDRDRAIGLESGLVALRRELADSYHPVERWDELDRRENEIRRAREARDATFAEVLQLLDLADDLVEPDLARSRATRADLLMEQWRIARATGDPASGALLRKVVALDDGGRYRDELAGTATLRMTTHPSGAELFLFRYEDLPTVADVDEPRRVPVPVRLDAAGTATLVKTAVSPGTWCLRPRRAVGAIGLDDRITHVDGHPVEGTIFVNRDADPVRRLDTMVECDGEPVTTLYRALRQAREYVFERDGETMTVDGSIVPMVADANLIAKMGDVDATVVRDGRVESVRLPPDGAYRVTAAPLFLRDECRLGATPVGPRRIAAGEYLALARCDGFEDVRLPFTVRPGIDATIEVGLVPDVDPPDGYVLVVPVSGS